MVTRFAALSTASLITLLSPTLHAQTLRFDDLPHALRAMVESRATLFSTAQVRWRVQWPDGDVDWKDSTYAQNGFALIEREASESEFDGNPAPPFTFCENRNLWFSSGDHAGEQWSHIERNAQCLIYTGNAGVRPMMPDLRSAGQLPDVSSYSEPAQLDPYQLLLSEINRDGIGGFQERKTDNGRIQVTAQSSRGEQIVWDIDPSLDWAPTRVQKWRGEELVLESVMEYDRFDDRWFLRSLSSSADGRPRLHIDVDDAEFDRPYHAKELTVDQVMPMPMGMGLNRQEEGGVDRLQYYLGDGRAFDKDDHETYNELRRKGLFDVMPYSRMLRENVENPPGRFPKCDEKGYYNDPKTAREPRLWENYTRSFIAVNKLQEKQTRAAWEVLRDCQRRAYEYLDKIKDNLKDLREDRVKAQSALKSEFGDSQSAQNAEQELVQLEERESKLMEKIEAIFKDLLRPGLFKLLTPEQRQAEAARHFAQVKPETLTAEAAEKAKP